MKTEWVRDFVPVIYWRISIRFINYLVPLIPNNPDPKFEKSSPRGFPKIRINSIKKVWLSDPDGNRKMKNQEEKRRSNCSKQLISRLILVFKML